MKPTEEIANRTHHMSHRTTDPMLYYVKGPGKDAATACTRLPVEVKHLLNVLCASRVTPFETPGEIMRAATVWFLNEIVPRWEDTRIEEGLKRLNEFIEDSQADAVLYNMGRTQNAAKLRIANFLQAGMRKEAAETYNAMIERATEAHPRYGKIMRAWAEGKAFFAPIREQARAMRLGVVADTTKCSLDGCGHTFRQHKDKDGGVGECHARGCECMMFNDTVEE